MTETHLEETTGDTTAAPRRNTGPRWRTRAMAAALFAGMSLTSLAAWAGEITGTITDAATGQPLAGACATVHGVITEGTFIDSQPTGPDGVYRIENLVPDKYEVFAHDCTDPFDYSPVDYKNILGLNRNKAKFVAIKKEDQVKKKINFALPRAGHIHVTVLDSAEPNVPISGVFVTPYWFERDKKKNGNQFQSGFGTQTDSNGETLLDVTPGGSKIQILTLDGSNNVAILCYYNAASDFDSADVVDVAANATQSITVFLNGPDACGSGDIAAN
jgi:hypothetical protein